jgi:hypothetical protein
MEPVGIAFLLVLVLGVTGYALGFFRGGGVVSMSNLTAAQIATVASNAGFSGDDLVIAVAIALAESSGNPNAHGDVKLGTGTGSFGLWQIYADAHPEYGPDFSALYDPQKNANAAFEIYQGRGGTFQDWSTFKSGAYTAYLNQANEGVSA